MAESGPSISANIHDLNVRFREKRTLHCWFRNAQNNAKYLSVRMTALPSEADTDQYIAVVLLHAVQAGVSVDIVESVFAKYHCVAQLAPYSAHRRIVDYIGDERVQELCPEEELRRIYVVAADGGANLREGPAADSPKIGAVAEGVAVENGQVEGDWIRVETFMGNGYMHRSTLRQYLPERFD